QLIRDDVKGAIRPFEIDRLAPLAQAIGWLVVSHHRLPTPDDDPSPRTLKDLLSPVMPSWNGARSEADARDKAACWDFPHGTPFDSRDWARQAAACARKMLDRPGFVERAPSLLD